MLPEKDLLILKKQLESPRDICIAVLGDIMLDKYTYGMVERISPEAPIPVVTVEREIETLGGSGNIISNLNGLNSKAVPIGVVGDDIYGSKVYELIKSLGITDHHIIVSKDQTTTLKTRVIANNQQLLRIDWDSSSPSANEKEKLKQSITNSLNNVDVMIISDYAKGVCSLELVKYTIEAARDQSIPVFVDPKGNDYLKYRGSSCITPNTNEAQDVVPFKLDSVESFEKAANWIRDQFSIDVCIITRGEAGMVLSDGVDMIQIPTIAQEVFDVSGAGDTVIATMAVCIALGLDYKSAAKVANTAGGIVVSYIGTSPIKIKSLIRRLNKQD